MASPAPPALRSPKYVVAVIALATIYLVSARIGLTIDAVAGFATLVWPATGIALAALVSFGYRLWPGVFIGAFVANVLTGAPPLVALGIAAGNTLEAVAGTWMLRRVPGFRPALDRLADVLAVITLAAGLSTMISATIGVASLHFGGILPLAQMGAAWRAWWVGDLIGDLVVAPLLLVWIATPMPERSPRLHREGVALIVAVAVVAFVVFNSTASDPTTFGQAYLVFPGLIWATLRFGLHGAVTTTFVTSFIAIWGTASGHGPFARPVMHESLFALQVFMGVAAATFLVLGASIAERRRAEEALRRAHRIVTEANRAKSEFLAVMSHELRTPLNAISGYVELMSLEARDFTETQNAYLARIRSNQQHLLTMIDDVLSFAKVEAGRLSLALSTVPVCEMLAELGSVIEPEVRRKNLLFTRHACDAALTVRADPERLRQILLNLIANAVKFTGAGGRVTVGAARDGRMIRVWVSDTGIGIPSDQLERVFEPFFQVDRGTTRSYPGIGLGLAIARDFARAMGGELRLESESGKGTTAVVELPAA
jgi:signal transduction histidine kinase